MISQAELSIALARLEYPTSVRTLTDWRHKGLLPKFRERRRGKGTNHPYCWRQKEIVQHAYCLADALAHNVTAERAALLLGFSGFEIDPQNVRRTWLKHLSELEDKANPPRADGEYADDHIRQTGIKLASQIERLPGVDESAAELLTIECLKAIYPSEPFYNRQDELQAVASAATAWLIAALQQKQIDHDINLTAEQLDRWLSMLRLQFSFSEIKELLKSCSIDEFRCAIGHFNKLVANVERFSLMYFDEPDKMQIVFGIRSLFRAILGPILLALFLRLIKEGHEKRLRLTGQLVSELVFQLNRAGLTGVIDADVKNDLLKQAMPDIGPRFLAIWKDFDLFRLYHIGKAL